MIVRRSGDIGVMETVPQTPRDMRPDRLSRGRGVNHAAGGTAGMTEFRCRDGRADAHDLDRRVLRRLQRELGGDPLVLLQIIRLFIDALDEHAAQIDDAARQRELVTLARCARHMRPGAEVLGATALADALTAFEESAESGDAAACQRLAGAFGRRVAKTHTDFHSLIDELGDAVPVGRV
jgi:HPt (histidine-containing phosphotransfer) domain-containing protein